MHYTNASFLYGASASSFTHTQTAVSIPTAVTALIIHSWGLMSSSLWYLWHYLLHSQYLQMYTFYHYHAPKPIEHKHMFEHSECTAG